MSHSTCVSVIVPVYNVEPYLAECVESILRQTYRDFELILVDDGSTDASGRMCDGFARRDPRIRVIHKPNGGLSSARNAGLDVARGEYVSFVDSDDVIHHAFLEILLKGIRGYDMCFCEIQPFSSDFLPDLNSEPICNNCSVWAGDVRMADASLCVVSACTKLYRRWLFDMIRFPEGVLYEDKMTFFQFFHLAKSSVFVNSPLYFYRYNPSSISNSPKHKAEGYMCFVLAALQQCNFYANEINDMPSLLLAYREGRGSWLHYVHIAGLDRTAMDLLRALKTVWKNAVPRNERRFGEFLLFYFPSLYVRYYRRIASNKSKEAKISNAYKG